MAETETRPVRKRAPRGASATVKPVTVAPKAAAVKPAPAATSTSDEGKQRISFSLEALDPTKSYAVFTPPADSGCVGKLYVPLGTEEVKVLLIGPAS